MSLSNPIIGTLTDGTARTVDLRGVAQPLSVWVRPVAGDSITVSYSYDLGANWTVWPNGVATVALMDSLVSGITTLQFQRTAGAGVTSTYGVC